MSDRDLRELERRAYNSDEDFLRYSTARLRAGLGPVEIVTPVTGFRVFLVRRDAGWSPGLDPDQQPGVNWVRVDPVSGWGLLGHALTESEDIRTLDDAHKAARRLAEEGIRKTSSNPPGRDDAINAAFKEWQAGDDASLERLTAERARAGLTPTPKHPELKVMEGAKAEGWNGKKRLTGKQAELALMHELKGRGWKPDAHASVSLRVWISPDASRRVLFNRKTVTWETGGRGRWEKDYKIHQWGVPYSTIDAATNIMRKKASKPLMRDQWTHPMQNPPDKDVVYSLASLAQHGRTSTTLAALVKLTGRTPGQVAAVVRALAERGIVNVRGPLVVFDRRVVSAAVGGPAVGQRMANPGADERRRSLQRAAKHDPQAAERLIAESRRAGEVGTGGAGPVGEEFTAVAYATDGRQTKVKAWRTGTNEAICAYHATYRGKPPGLGFLTYQSEFNEDRSWGATPHWEFSRWPDWLQYFTGGPLVVGGTMEEVEATAQATVAWIVSGNREQLFRLQEQMEGYDDETLFREQNPGSADERMRALQRAARREQETYGVAAEDTEAAKLLQREQERRSVPALGERAYLTDILKAWGVTGHGGWVSLGEASKGLQAVFKKAGIKARLRSQSYSMGAHITVSAEGRYAEPMARLFDVDRVDRFRHQSYDPRAEFSIDVYPNKRVDKSDYFDPGGVTLPQEFFQTYAEGVMKAAGSKKTAAEKKEAKKAAASDARGAAPLVLLRDDPAPAHGERYLFEVPRYSNSTWEFTKILPGGSRGDLYQFYRVGARGIALKTEQNGLLLSDKDWTRIVTQGLVRIAPRTNPGLAVLGWAGNPGGTLTLQRARKRLRKLIKLGHHTLLNDLVARTRPRDQDKLKAEIAHAFRKKNPGEGGRRPLGHQQGGKKKTLTMEQAIAAGVDKAPGFAQALKEYRKFHGADPHSVDVYRYASSKNDTKVMVTMGRVPETQYVVDGGKDSNKAGHHWVHKHREKGKGREPNLLFDPVSGTMQIAGGSYKVTSWIYH